MAICRKCGAFLPEGAAACTVCGEPTPRESFPSAAAQQPVEPQAPAALQEPVRQQAPAPAATPVKKGGGKKIALISGAAVLVLGLAAAAILLLPKLFNQAPADPNLGLWKGVEAENMGAVYSADELFPMGVSIELKKNGKCAVLRNGVPSSGTWSLAENGAFHVRAQNCDFDGRLADGAMVVQDSLEGMIVTLVRQEEPSPPPAESNGIPAQSGVESIPEIEEKPDEAVPVSSEPGESAAGQAAFDPEWWNGDWYGWWIVSNCTGRYQVASNDWYDCGAAFQLDSEGRGTVTLRDENGVIATVQVSLSEGTTAAGRLTVESGEFRNTPMQAGDWAADPGTQSSLFFSRSDYDHFLVLTGSMEDADGSYTYTFHMKPWGMDWSDIEAEQPNDVPYYYKAWYLPLLRDGASMPEEIGK